MLVVSVLLVVALSKRDVAGMTNMAELEELRAEDLVFTLTSGVNNLCLFNSFAHGTRLDPVNLRRRVCAFMQANPTTQVSDIGMNVNDFVAFECSTMNQLNERVLQRDGAGLTVAASLATMLGRNVEVYQRKRFAPGGAPRVRGSDAYVQILDALRKRTRNRLCPVLRQRWQAGNMEASGGAGDVRRLPREEGQSHLARRRQQGPGGEALPDPAGARLDVDHPRRPRQGDVTDHQAG